jgi:hypothetical protein
MTGGRNCATIPETLVQGGTRTRRLAFSLPLLLPEALQKHLLLSELDRWGPIIKASGQFAD